MGYFEYVEVMTFRGITCIDDGTIYDQGELLAHIFPFWCYPTTTETEMSLIWLL